MKHKTWYSLSGVVTQHHEMNKILRLGDPHYLSISKPPKAVRVKYYRREELGRDLDQLVLRLRVATE